MMMTVIMAIMIIDDDDDDDDGFMKHSLRTMVALLQIAMIMDDHQDQGHHDDH